MEGWARGCLGLALWLPMPTPASMIYGGKALSSSNRHSPGWPLSLLPSPLSPIGPPRRKMSEFFFLAPARTSDQYQFPLSGKRRRETCTCLPIGEHFANWNGPPQYTSPSFNVGGKIENSLFPPEPRVRESSLIWEVGRLLILETGINRYFA